MASAKPFFSTAAFGLKVIQKRIILFFEMVRRITILLFFAWNAYGQTDSLLEVFSRTDSAPGEPLTVKVRAALEKYPLKEADERVEKKILEVGLRSVPSVYLNRLRSHLYHHAQRTEEGLVFTLRAREIATALNHDVLIAECNQDMGYYYTVIGLYSIAGEYFAEAAEIFSKQQNTLSTAQCFYDLALVNYRAGNTRESILNQLRSIREYKKINPDSLKSDEFFVMSGYNTLGLAYQRLEKFDSALFFNRRADSIASKNNNVFWKALLGGNIGEVLLKQGKPREALPLLKSDYTEMQKHNDTNLIFTSALYLAECYLTLGEADSASILLADIQRSGIHPGGRGRYWRVVAQLHEKRNNGKSAIAALRNALDFQDSVWSNAEAVKLSRLKTVYELQQKDSDIRNLTTEVEDKQQQLQQQRNRIVLIGIFLLLTLAFAAMFYRFNSKNKSQLRIITGQKIEIDNQNHELEAQSEMVISQKEEITAQNDKLQETIEELKTTQSQLVQIEKMAALGQITAGITNEINNPLNFITGGVDALARPIQELSRLSHQQNVKKDLQRIDELEKDIQDLINAIKDGVHRSNKIITSLQAFSSPQESRFSRIDLRDITDMSLTILNAKIRQHQIEVTHDYTGNCEIFGNASQLLQLFANLIDNAVHAMLETKPPRKLHIAIITLPNKVHVTFSDNGNEIPEDLQRKIFEPFISTNPNEKGTGLGLSITYSVIEKHRGTISFTSKPGMGTEFKIVLPC